MCPWASNHRDVGIVFKVYIKTYEVYKYKFHNEPTKRYVYSVTNGKY